MPAIDQTTISAIRMAVLVGWTIVTLLGAPAWRRALLGHPIEGDWVQAALGIVGVALVGFQVNVLSGAVPPRTDYWSAVFLLLLALGAAVVLFLVYLPRTPVAHRRAVMWSHLAVLILCVIGGTIE